MALNTKHLTWVLLPIAALLYYLFAFEFTRTQHAYLLTGFLVLCIVSIVLFRSLQQKRWMFLFATGLVFRLIFLVAPPHLSDDFYRFTWDGELLNDGYSSFAFIPSEYADFVAPEDTAHYGNLLRSHSEEFPTGMNSKNYFSIYPTVNQFIFYTAALGGDPNGENLIIMRLWILIAEVVSFFLLKWLLSKQKKEGLLGLYWLHPLIIIELTGNLHFEALAITFILLALYFALKNKTVATALSVALAIMTKLTPLFLIGGFFKDRTFKNWIGLSVLTGLFTIGLFAMVVDLETISNFKGSVGLFFAWFSFNAGPYFFIRDTVIFFGGNDISSGISLVFPIVTVLLGSYIVFLKKFDVATTILLLFTVYFMFSPIVHPWYITVLIPLGLLSQKIYPLVWSVLIFGTYLAYGEPFEHPTSITYLEYAAVLVTLYLEFKTTNRPLEKIKSVVFGSSS